MEIVKILTETNFLGNAMEWNHKKIYYTIIWFLERKKKFTLAGNAEVTESLKIEIFLDNLHKSLSELFVFHLLQSIYTHTHTQNVLQ